MLTSVSQGGKATKGHVKDLSNHLNQLTGRLDRLETENKVHFARIDTKISDIEDSLSAIMVKLSDILLRLRHASVQV